MSLTSCQTRRVQNLVNLPMTSYTADLMSFTNLHSS